MKLNLIKKIKLWLYARHAHKKAGHIGKRVFINNYWDVYRGVFVEDNVLVNGKLTAVGYGKLTIKSHTIIGPDLMVITSNHNFKNPTCLPYDDKDEAKDVVIGECVWIGARVTILPGTKIGEGAIIQAGAVVHGEIPPCAIAGGNPAKVFAYRDKELYYKLKAEGKYL